MMRKSPFSIKQKEKEPSNDKKKIKEKKIIISYQDVIYSFSFFFNGISFCINFMLTQAQFHVDGISFNFFFLLVSVLPMQSFKTEFDDKLFVEKHL